LSASSISHRLGEAELPVSRRPPLEADVFEESEPVPASWEVKTKVRRRLILLGGAWFGAMTLSIVVLYSVGQSPTPPLWLEYSFPVYWVATFLATTGLGVAMIFEARRAHSIPGFGLGIVAMLLPSVLLGRSVVAFLGVLYQFLN
jgi:hypothetical protein